MCVLNEVKGMKLNMKISIITSTYNRRDLLPRLKDSIFENALDYSNIEWLIMDDGSSISVEDLVEMWKEEATFPITFYKQENQGKMAALNHLIPHISGDIVIEMDDDDYFMPHVFRMIVEDYEKIKDQEQIYGVIYEKELTEHNQKIPVHLDGKVKKLYDLHYRENADFDMVLTFKATYRKQFQYKLEHGERFSTEARMYYQMDEKKAGFLIHTTPIMICEYQETGYTKGLKNIFKKNPYGYFEFFKEALNYNMKGVKFSRRFYLIKHYILFTYLTKRTFKEASKYISGWNQFLFTCFYLPGKIASKKRFGDHK